MKEITAYNVKTRQQTTIKKPQLMTMKNGKFALKGVAADDNTTVVYRIISTSEARKFKKEA